MNRPLPTLPLSVWEQAQISVVWNLSMICFLLSCKHIEDWVAKTAFSGKENLAILILTKENNSWTKDKIKSQHLHECSIKTSIGVKVMKTLDPLKLKNPFFTVM